MYFRVDDDVIWLISQGCSTSPPSCTPPPQCTRSLGLGYKLHTFNGPLAGTTRVSRYQKGKTNLDFTEARDSEWQWHQLGICKSAPCSRQITTPAPHHSVFYRPDALPAAQPTASKHWRLGYKLCAVIPIAGQRTRGTTFPALKVTFQVATPGAESAVYDCNCFHMILIGL